jgi:putative ABC transport system ATP-binding protein
MSICLEQVVKSYPGGVTALNGVSIEVPDGDRVAVVGPSGSGKTTMLTILGTLERPTEGKITVEGIDIAAASDRALAGLRAHRIGFVFQAFHLQESMSALDNVANGMLYTGVSLHERRDSARWALERVGLGHRIDFRSKQLSGGERQRVAIARALAKRPAIVLADEPTGNLDSKSGAGVLDLLHELSEEGATLVLITHDEKIASGFPRQLQMRDGEIVADVEPDHEPESETA